MLCSVCYVVFCILIVCLCDVCIFCLFACVRVHVRACVLCMAVKSYLFSFPSLYAPVFLIVVFFSLLLRQQSSLTPTLTLCARSRCLVLGMGNKLTAKTPPLNVFFKWWFVQYCFLVISL